MAKKLTHTKKKKKTPKKAVAIDPNAPKIERRGGKRKGAGAKPLPAAKRRRGFYCYVTEEKAIRYADPKAVSTERKWRTGINNLQKIVQQSIDRDL